MSQKRKQCESPNDDEKDKHQSCEKKQKYEDQNIWIQLNHIGKDAIAWLRHDFISTEDEKQQLFEMMRDEIPWIRHVLYKNSAKEMKQARLSCSMGAAYAYSGSVHPQSEWHPKVLEIMNRINQEYDTHFNSCLLNYYQDGSQYISAHSDQDKYLDKQNCLINI
jgi:alkylated DNA repair dioxygenase AlkB